MEEFENDETKITKGLSKEVMTSKVKGETTNGGVSRAIIKPRVVEGFVQKIVMKKYGLRVVNVEELDGYYDRNYHIRVDSNHKHPSLGSLHEHGYLLKIHNSTESSVPEILDEQHMLLEHLLKNSINTQKVIPNLAGDMYSLECCHEELREQDKHENNACAVELRTYIPGQLIKDVPYSVGLMMEVGRLVANVTNVFQTLRSPDYNGRKLGQWSLRSISKLKRFTFCLQDGQRSHINTVIDSFSERVATKYFELPKGYIHGDLNESNILVSQNDVDDGYHMSGVLDVGDAEYSCPVFDLAVNLTYMMLDSEMVDQLDTPGYILSGYLSVRSLTSTEWQVLVPCMAGRLVQSLTLGAYSRYLQQGSDHNSTVGAKTWSLLTEFCAQPEETLLHRWKSIVDTCYIHGDLNESNILVSQNHGDEEYHMSGFLDVGDAEYSCPVFDLAVNLTFMMLDSEMVDQLDTPGYILSGYLSVRSLTSTEWQVLVPCMAGRLAQSLTLGAYSRYLQQGRDHNSTAGAKTWSLLTEFCAQPEETLLHRWKSIVDTCYVKFF